MAWFMAHRLREAFRESGKPFCGLVEVDETYIGGKRKYMSARRTAKGTVYFSRNQAPVVVHQNSLDISYAEAS